MSNYMPAGANGEQHETGHSDAASVEANARLIASAPELHGLLEEVTGVIVAGYTALFPNFAFVDPPSAVERMTMEILNLRGRVEDDGEERHQHRHKPEVDEGQHRAQPVDVGAQAALHVEKSPLGTPLPKPARPERSQPRRPRRSRAATAG